MTSSGRATTRTPFASTTPSRTRIASRSSCELAALAGFERLNLTTFYGRSSAATDQDRVATAAATRRIERADVDANDYGVRAFGERLLGRARLETGLDLNGRFGLNAVDDLITFTPSGDVASTRPLTSIDVRGAQELAVRESRQPRSRPSSPWARACAATTSARATKAATSARVRRRRPGAPATWQSRPAASAAFTLTAQVARGFRDPTLSDRYYRGPTGRGFIRGNPDLDPESSLQFDGSLRFTGRRLRLAAYGYHYRIDDLVERYEAEPDTFFFRNRGRARLRGLELEAQVDLRPGTERRPRGGRRPRRGRRYQRTAG